jgi:uncharacterized protein GlcG (DUF336 family)
VPDWTPPGDLPLGEARALIQRAVDKAEQLGVRGAVAVVGASGALISASRMDAGGPGGMARARSKAWISATQQIPTAEHHHRMTTLAPPIAAGFVQASPEAVFPGAGGLPIYADQAVVAGIAASGATVSPFFPDGVAPASLTVAGQPANPEDLLIAYALQLPYTGQHGDDQPRWVARFGDLNIDPADSAGMSPAPAASRQAELAWARGLCDRVLREAERRDLRVAVAVVDRGGDAIQQDLMDGGPAGGVAVAQAVANAAALFDGPSDEVARRYGGVERLAAILIPAVLGVAGGLPVRVAGRLAGALGVGGPEPAVCAELAAAALGPP